MLQIGRNRFLCVKSEIETVSFAGVLIVTICEEITTTLVGRTREHPGIGVCISQRHILCMAKCVRFLECGACRLMDIFCLGTFRYFFLYICLFRDSVVAALPEPC